MERSNPDGPDTMQHLEKIVEELGLAHVVYLLADIADHQSDLLSKSDTAQATRLAHDAKLLGRTAIVLLG
jgi:hypothetical protein